MRTVLDRLLDASLFWSFDRSGYRRHARHFRASDLDVDLTGRVCAITGANSGIGYATAQALAARRADVWLLCRDPAKGEVAVRDLRAATGSPRVFLGVLDVSHLASVRAFVGGFAPPRVDVLIHNAGVLPAERTLTPEGLELTLATNVIGPHLLSLLLRPRLKEGRIVLVSSGGMYGTRLSLDDLDWSRRRFDGVAAYAQTKRMQVVLAGEISRRWSIPTHAMHPGWVDTPALRASLPRFFAWMKHRLRTPEEGADTVVWLAVAPDLPPGRFWLDRAPQPEHLLPFQGESDAERARLWDLIAGLSVRT